MNAPEQPRFQPHPPQLSEPAGGNWTAPAPPWLCPLSDFSLVRVSGKGAFDFLNNQLSNDLQTVPENMSQLSGYCNPKGRLYCTMRIFMRGADYCMRTTAGVSDTVIDRLRLFVLRADVTFDTDTTLGGIALIGPGTDDLLQRADLPVPAVASAAAHDGEHSVIRSPGVCERYEIYAPHGELASLWNTLARDAVPADGGVWRLYDIFSGIPNIYPETSELFVPQMANLDLAGGLSFSKGCYPGQEVVARTHYLGKLKRRMYRFSLPQSPLEPQPGDAVFVSAYSDEQPSGEIMDTYKLPDGTLEGLASLRIRGLERKKIRLGSPNGAEAQIRPLPYEVTAETQAGTENKS